MAIVWGHQTRGEGRFSNEISQRMVGDVTISMWDDTKWREAPAPYSVIVFTSNDEIAARCDTLEEAMRVYNNDAVTLIPRSNPNG